MCFFAYVAHLWFLRDVWIQTQSADVASRRANNLATHPPNLATHPAYLATHPLFLDFSYIDMGFQLKIYKK